MFKGTLENYLASKLLRAQNPKLILTMMKSRANKELR